MAFGEIKLRPGVVADWTPTLNEAGYSQSQLIRFRDGLAQKFGGWQKFYPFAVSGIPRDLHAWQDLNAVDHLSVGTTTVFGVITGGNFQSITPQTLTSDFAPNFSTIINTPTVTIIDPNINNVTTFDSVFFNTPISIGGIILSGIYPIVEVTGATSYQITAAMNATATVNNAGAVPAFTAVSGSAIVEVTLANHGLSVGSTIVFSIPTTFDGVTVSGSYAATTIVDSSHFDIQLNTQATGSSTVSMNSGNAEIVYYIALGPPAGGSGYGLGGYGLGGYGTGVAPVVQVGTPISATDWTSDNWGQLILGCPADGGIYYWDPTGGFANMPLVSSGPPFNSGIFVSTTSQILVAYGSTLDERTNGGIGMTRDPMLVQWSDSEDFFTWTPTDANFAGNYRIPIGSEIRAGIAGAANQNLIWTDLDLWAMNFIDQPDVYGFTQIGAGAGACSRHSPQKFRGSVYWMGSSNFYVYDGGGVRVLPCPVWDAVFQNFNVTFQTNVRAMPNTPNNEIGWLYPSSSSMTGENDSYVKMNVTEAGNPWDYGLSSALPRSAWIDQSVLGPPIGASPGGVIYSQETTNDADGQPLVWSYTTGYAVLGDGEQRVQVDQFMPDFIWSTFAANQNAQILITINVVDFPGQTPRTYGPYLVTIASKYVTTRFTGRQASWTISGQDLGSFSRLGRIRYRYRAIGMGGTLG